MPQRTSNSDDGLAELLNSYQDALAEYQGAQNKWPQLAEEGKAVAEISKKLLRSRRKMTAANVGKGIHSTPEQQRIEANRKKQKDAEQNIARIWEEITNRLDSFRLEENRHDFEVLDRMSFGLPHDNAVRKIRLVNKILETAIRSRAANEGLAGKVGVAGRGVVDEIQTVGPTINSKSSADRAQEIHFIQPVHSNIVTAGCAGVISLAQQPQRPPQFPNRAEWLRARLKERNWSKSKLTGPDGPDHKTIKKIFDGRPVREDVLERLAAALSCSRKFPPVKVEDIPAD